MCVLLAHPCNAEADHDDDPYPPNQHQFTNTCLRPDHPLPYINSEDGARAVTSISIQMNRVYPKAFKTAVAKMVFTGLHYCKIFFQYFNL